MMNIFKSCQNTGRALALSSLMTVSLGVNAAIEGTPGTVFDLYANQAQISTPDGDSFQIWGFADSAGGAAQYPGPTLIVDEGNSVSITVYNNDVTQQSVSLVFPGQTGISKTCSIGPVPSTTGCYATFADGANVVAAGFGHFITYTFEATKPGTYMYHSGVSPQIQIEMGLVGTLIVRPATPAPADAEDLAYNDVATAYDSEFLFVMSEMDPKLHYLAENNALDQWDNAAYNSVLFFINGRNAPDTLAGDFAPELPHQPYGSLVSMVPGERVLLRTLNVGRHQHPLHLHGNHYDQIARDGNMLTTAGGALGAITDYTLGAVPGSTADLLFSWTGKGMGWDIFNSASAHGSCNAGTDDAVDNRTNADGPDGFHDVTWEWCADHGKDIPVVIPENQDLGFGGFYGGSPYLGDVGSLPIGEGGLNPSGGMVFMWHSHSERELTNNDIYPGGMLTMAIVNKR
jgi:FtsP/CotA-like multicopper oxidase with cupredoxin domain